MKKSKQAHTANTKFGMGDFYGRAIPPKIGKMRGIYTSGSNPVAPKKLSKPPKSVA